jgi:hypothetical protein
MARTNEMVKIASTMLGCITTAGGLSARTAGVARAGILE